MPGGAAAAMALVRCKVSSDTRLGLEGSMYDAMKRPRHKTPSAAKRARSGLGLVEALGDLGDAAVADAAEADGLSLEGRRERAAGPLPPDGLSGLVHGALLASIVAKLGVHEVEAGSRSVSAEGTAARSLYESLGFITRGPEPDSLRIDGSAVSQHHMLLKLSCCRR